MYSAVFGELVEAAQQPLGRAEEQTALDFDQADPVAGVVEEVAFLRRPQALGADDVAEQFAADHGAAVGVVAKDVEAEGLGDFAADGDATDAVAVRGRGAARRRRCRSGRG